MSQKVCKCSSCATTPLGYRVLRKHQYESHKHISTLPVSTTVSQDQIKKESHSFLSEVSSQLQASHIRNLRVHELKFKSNIQSNNHPEEFSSYLLQESPINRAFLQYERWHKSAVNRLECLGAASTADPVVKDTLANMSAFHSRVITRLILSWRKQSTPTISTVGKAAMITLLENDIRTALVQYEYPISLEMSCICDSFQQHDPRCSASETVHLNFGLDPSKSNNRSTTEQMHWVDTVLNELHAAASELPVTRVEELVAGLIEHRDNILAHISAQRFRNAHPDSLIRVCVKNLYRPILLFPPPLVMAAMIVLSLTHLYHLPRETISDFLAILQQQFPSYGLSEIQLPRDPRSYEKIINMKIEEDQCILCPGCGASYSPRLKEVSSEARCSARPSQESRPCGRELYRKRGNRLIPVLLFRRRYLGDWLQQLLMRPGMVHKVDQAWEQVHQPPQSTISDFWGGSFARTMKGPDSTTLFSSVPPNETRLLLSLAVDWFNPFHNKAAGQVASTGVMFITCLNLSPSERYKDENVYLVGVLPGSRQAGNLDGILEPLVKDLLQYWDPGVYFSGLPGVETLRLIRCALVQIICDLPAARKVAGFPGHNATCHCSVCFSLHRNIADLSTAHDDTLRRNLEDHMEHAYRYKSTLETKGRRAAEALLKSNPRAVRWSPLNELPYWHPVHCTVIDPMHLVLLGLCQFHWRRFWGGDQIPDVSTGILDEYSRGEAETRHLPDFNPCKASGIPVMGETEYPEPNHLQLPDDSQDCANVMQSPRQNMSLAASLMNDARVVWIMKPSQSFSKLSATQMLCLLQENDAIPPTSFSKKAELVKLLESHRQNFSHLPQQYNKSGKNYPNLSERMSITAMFLGHNDIILSNSEKLLGSMSPVAIPDVQQIGSRHISFITRDELDNIQADISKIIVPSWVTKPRVTFGQKSNGRVKAAEWRSIFSIYLPMTLTRLWVIEKTRGFSNVYVLHLKALLILAVIVNIVTSKTLSSATVQSYDNAIELYLRLISMLNEDQPLVVNHHLALHLSEFMQRYGPCRGYWAFPFERMIGKLHKISHNARIDDIPGRLFNSFVSGAMLKSLTQQGIEPASLPRWKQPQPKRKIQSTRVYLKKSHLEHLKSIYGELAVWATSVPETVHDDVLFRCSDTHSVGDTFVGFITSQTKEYRIGKIKQILVIKPQPTRDTKSSTEVAVFLVAVYRKAPKMFQSHLLDEVIKHNAIRMLIVSTDEEEEDEIVTLDKVIGHVAIRGLGYPHEKALMTLQLTTDFESRRRPFLPK